MRYDTFLPVFPIFHCLLEGRITPLNSFEVYRLYLRIIQLLNWSDINSERHLLVTPAAEIHVAIILLVLSSNPSGNFAYSFTLPSVVG